MKSSTTNNSIINFNNFGLNSNLLKVIKEIGYKYPTEIQKKCIPLFLKGQDILAIAKTGSGKTASFVLPILNKVNIKNNLQILVLSPTRELVIQISNFFKIFSKYIKNIKILPLYGGQSYKIQFLNLKLKPHIIVATPGRLLDHINKKKTLSLSNIKMLVIDEADEMLHMGFINDVKIIINKISCLHQTALFSATMSLVIRKIIKDIMNNPKEIIISDKYNLNIKQYYCFINFKNKFDTLIKFLEIEFFTRLIIFVKTKDFSLKLSSLIEKKGYLCSPLNGDMNQFLREKIILNFRKGIKTILIATDIASRGLDIKDVNLIINYDIPYDTNSYIHRIGRTGRADNIGKAILFLERKDMKFLLNIKRIFNNNINQIFIPKFKDLLNCRLNKIISLIENNLNRNNLTLNFYNKFLNKIIKSCNKKLFEITVSYLIYIYEKNFSKLFYKDILNIEKKFKN